MRTVRAATATLAMALALRAGPVPVPNPSFEEGDGAPAGWSPSGPGVRWGTGPAADGQRCLEAAGTGNDTTYWRSAALPLVPGALYRISFLARSIAASGGTAVTGPVFCNRDIGCPPTDWTRYTAVFVCPDTLSADQSWLRFGQWHVNGTVAFDAVTLTEVQAVHQNADGLALGEGESIAGNAYEFTAPLGGAGLNHSRPLAAARCAFNSNRWVFGADSEVVYAHRVGDRQQTSARVEVTVGWYSSGRLQVDVSRDGGDWQPAGTLDAVGTLAFDLPAGVLPAREVRVRLKAAAKEKVGAAESDPGSFQVHGYRYLAAVDGPPVTARGQTLYAETEGPAEGWRVEVLSFGEGLPGAENRAVLRVTNATGRAAQVAPVAALRREGSLDEVRTTGPAVSFGPGSSEAACPYTVSGSGTFELTVALGAPVAWSGKAELHVPEFYEAGYGELLPGSGPGAAMWWASSGWKIPRTRPPPTARGEALRISAAGNEAEAAQLVLRPAAPLRGLTLTPADLRGPDGHTLKAACVQVLRVGYVPVTRKTDPTGVVADWPDPLPPLRGPADLPADVNQPFWVRVKVPAGTPPGVYRGSLALRAEGYEAACPLEVEVFGFDLPRRMTCQTAFGFDPGTAWRYQGVTDAAQRRQVLDLYLRSYGDHHICPYNPAPMDPFTVSWPNLGDWHGGVRDTAVKAQGQTSLRLEDTSPTACVSARYTKPITIPAGGLRIRMSYRTQAPGHVFLVTLNHSDAAGQWMSGRNNDMPVTGDGSWQTWDRTITAFPAGARSVTLTIWATRWSEAGEATGCVWVDGVQVTDAGTGASLVPGGDFEPPDAAALTPQIAWERWDQAVARALDEFGFNTFAMPVMGLGGGTFHSRQEPELLGFAESTPEYQTAMKAYLGALDAHLREKGWTEEAFVYWFDEPEPRDYEFVMNGFRKLRQWAPALRRMLTEQVEDALVGGPNLWCPLTPAFDPAKAAERRREGEQFWWYVCTGPKAPYATLFIDHPGTELRVWLWQTWERAIDGILVWHTNYWTSPCAYPDPNRPQNPYLDPMGWVSGYDTPAGTRIPWGNGDGRFVYPPEAAADAHPAAPVLEGPVDSIRWEMLRDGIEDYEYFAILRGLLRDKGPALDADTRRRAEALLTVPQTVTVDLTHFTRDPAPLEAHRRLLGQAITDLARR